MLAHTGVVVSPDRHDDSRSSSAPWTQATDAAKSTRKGTSMDRNRTLKLMAYIASGSVPGGRILKGNSFPFDWFLATSNKNSI